MRDKENPFSEKIIDFDQRIKAALEKKQLKDMQAHSETAGVFQDVQELSSDEVEE